MLNSEYGASSVYQRLSINSSIVVMEWKGSVTEFNDHADNILDTDKLEFDRLKVGTIGLVISSSLDINSMASPGTFDMILSENRVFIVKRQNLKLIKT